MSVSRDNILDWIKASAAVIGSNKEYLTQLDSAIGDADHGINMDRGYQAVIQKLPGVAQQDIGAIFKAVGMTLISTVGGASGPLYGTFFIQLGTATAGKKELSLADWTTALEAALNGILSRGKASLGDKTMVDALTPAVAALKSAQANQTELALALRQCAEAAEKGMQGTVPLLAKKGRASYLGERSIGHQDPGATSVHLLLKAAADTWAPAS
jgi:phosphoenolpyruvate---glycerone phosphotransferase subunit DhaL